MSSFELPHGPGLYLIDKPAGLSSAKVVSHKRHTGTQNRHGGTLDLCHRSAAVLLDATTKQADSSMGTKRMS